MRFFCTLLGLMVMVGCFDSRLPSGPCGRSFTASGFTASETHGLDQAAMRWNEIAIEQFCITDGQSEEHHISRVEYGGPEWKDISNRFGGANVLGVHYGSDDAIVIVSGLDEATFELVALHEMGHAHGLGHTEAPSVMHASIGTATDFTAIDIAECRRAEACASESSLREVKANEEPIDYVFIAPN